MSYTASITNSWLVHGYEAGSPIIWLIPCNASDNNNCPKDKGSNILPELPDTHWIRIRNSKSVDYFLQKIGLVKIYNKTFF